MGNADRQRDYEIFDRYTRDEGTVFMTGIQALARLPLEQLRVDRHNGLNTAAFVSGYPGSPLGGYDGAIAHAAKCAADLSIVCRPALNEEYAATAVMGSQLAMAQPDARYHGVLGIWYGKAPGVDRAADALRHAVYAGTCASGGAIALVGDDPAAKSSTLPSSSAAVLADMHMPLLYPGDPAEALDLGRHAIALSRSTGLWTALKIVADVADGSATVHLDLDRVAPVIPLDDGVAYNRPPNGHLLTPATIEMEREIYEVRYRLARQYAQANRLNRTTADPAQAWIGIVSSGITYLEVREALTRLGLRTNAQIEDAGIRLLKMQMPIPFNNETVRHFARGLDEVFVIEEKQPNLESLIKDALYSLPDRPAVVGKTDEHDEYLLPGHGSLDADHIISALRARLSRRLADRLAPPDDVPNETLAPLSVARTPYYCSGCPHNRSTEVPQGSLVGAGIGCHTMALLMDETRVGDITGITAMGNEGTQWIGMSEFVERAHMFQNLGDGTFFHSGQLAIQAAIAAGVSITYKLLYNGAVAMTGGQHPQGQTPVPEVAAGLLAHGVKRVLITTDHPDDYDRSRLPVCVEVWDRKRLTEAQRLLAAIPGVTILIHDQHCAAELRRARKRGLAVTPSERVVINHRVCEGCGDCGDISNCLSVQPIETPFGTKTTIDQTTCNLDYSCLEGDCPSFMTLDVGEPGPIRALFDKVFRSNRTLAPTTATTGDVPSRPVSSLPTPTCVVPEDEFAMRITGIGGTGVVTVSQIIGTAAMLDGFEVRGLDQIGLSQKAGPVVSDLRLSRGEEPDSSRIGSRQADLLLAFDQLVAASEKGLLTASPTDTAVVGSTTETPTGAMIGHPDMKLPTVEALLERIRSTSRGDQQHWADSAAITEALFGESSTANIFVVGMAVQAGCLPVSVESLREAITLNAIAVENNLAAFEWGRTYIAQPAVVEQAVAGARSHGIEVQTDVQANAPALDPRLDDRIRALATVNTDLLASLRLYVSELRAYQNVGYADAYISYIESVAERERRAAPGSNAVTAAVAAGLFKLMAYKDEYEVARLLLDGSTARGIDGASARMYWHLHPPLLRALGLERKIKLGAWARPLLHLLARSKRLRGTRVDPFRYGEVRRTERELPGDYRKAMDKVLKRLNPGNIDDIAAIAELPHLVRGYEDIKMANTERYRETLEKRVARIVAA